MIKSYVTVSALYVNQSPLKELERLHSETQVEYCHYRWTLRCLMHRFPTLQALSAFFANVTRQSTTLVGYHRINSSFQMYEHVYLFRLRYYLYMKISVLRVWSHISLLAVPSSNCQITTPSFGTFRRKTYFIRWSDKTTSLKVDPLFPGSWDNLPPFCLLAWEV
jgi:hypothetical protein